VLIETVQGIRTVKALAIEPQQADAWNERVASSVQRQRDLTDASNQLQTLTAPIERCFYMGVLVFGTWMILNGSDTITMGSMFAFVLLSGRATGPLIAAAQLLHTLEHVRTAMAEAASILNQPPERPSNAVAIRPRLAGHVSFENVTFTYPGALNPALDKVSFDAPAGTLLGLVGRSGSGKSTITRLLQGLNSGYSGLVKLDGVEMREIDLQHLRRNLGVVCRTTSCSAAPSARTSPPAARASPSRR
jgi:ATP-binding cassette subfamily B protein